MTTKANANRSAIYLTLAPELGCCLWLVEMNQNFQLRKIRPSEKASDGCFRSRYGGKIHAESLVLHGKTATNKQLPNKLNPKAMLLPAGGKFLAVICCYLTTAAWTRDDKSRRIIARRPSSDSKFQIFGPGVSSKISVERFFIQNFFYVMMTPSGKSSDS